MNKKLESYIPRIMDSILEDKLQAAGAVYIKGPKWCGKSTTALKHSKSAVFMQNLEERDKNILLAKNSPSTFLQGETPKLIDEWQDIPFIWDQIKYEIDKRGQRGQFILTGSAAPVDQDAYHHSGIGRIIPVVMRPMSLYESKDSTGSVSLDMLFHNPDQFKPSNTNAKLLDYAYFTCRGGWPESIKDDTEIALEHARYFYNGLIEADINKMFKRNINSKRVNNILKSYARGIASEMSISKLKEDIEHNETMMIEENTINTYLTALRNLYIIEDLPAWNTNLRSKSAIRTSDVRHFIDPSIGCAALNISPADFIYDLRTFGFFFESLCIRDLRVYADKLKGKVYHYRDSRGLEADAIIQLCTGEWAAVEVKLSSSDSIDEGAKHLIKLKNDIDTTEAKAPSFLMVITTGEYAYRRDDGVYVIPLGALRD